MRIQTLIPLLAAGLIGSAAALHAVGQPPHPHGPGHVPPAGSLFQHLHGHFHEHLAALELTETQREAVHEVLQARRAEIVGAIRPVLEAKRTLHNAVLADRPDDAAIRAAGTTLGTSIGNAAVTVAKIKIEIVEKAKLTQEQKQKIAEFKAKHEASVDDVIRAIEGAGEKHAK
jgi:Spy/CpxP family protein refolding chaperone